MTYLFQLHVHLSGLEARRHMLLRLSAIPNSCQIVAITQIVQKTGIHHAREMLGCVQQQKIQYWYREKKRSSLEFGVRRTDG
jgi:hypothetical protein